MKPKTDPGTCIDPPPGVLFCGLIYSPAVELHGVLLRLAETWGDMEFISRRISFSGRSGYYAGEMGNRLFRKFLTFHRSVPQDSLPVLKQASRGMEDAFRGRDGGRTVNIDPGFLHPDRLVLATTKPGPHRVYLHRGIYAELALIFHKQSYRAFPWTYPDYSKRTTIRMLNALRTRHLYKEQWVTEGERT